jgi:predicted ATPase/class 3 adenylate cyclase
MNAPQSRLAADIGRLPSGTVTFVFTDIEGSTQRWERDRGSMENAVRRHDALVRAAIAANGGYVFKTIGDAFCAAFARPEAAVAAALEVQRAIAAEDFSAVDGVGVRVAIHTGTADERDGDYFGSAVNRVARLLAIGHGGQVLVSGVTTDLVQGALPARSSLRDLGEHRLKDLTQPEQVYQLIADGLPETFPSLRSLESLPNNLPLQLTSFVGRADEVAAIVELIGNTRLVTLVGTGGVGKTRTALQVAAELLDGSGDGVWFVDLAPIRDPALVSFEIASTLGLPVPPEKSAIEVVTAYLKSRRPLLIIDNCEHLVASAAEVIDAILRACPRVKILATSREGLNVNGESVYRMPSLGIPPEGARPSAVESSDYGAIALFAERARAADGRFMLTDENAPIVAEICRRLDGIALAIELAAPRVKVLAVEQLSRRLDERFRILTGGSRNALPRQQTMRALIDWSYDLLSDNEKLAFRRAGIFVGGFTLEAATAICSADTEIDDWEVLEILSTLVDKSLVAAEISNAQQRYRLLESMREYTRGRLLENEELDAVARAHAEYFLAFAETKHEQWDVTPGAQWIAPMLPEIDNFRAGLGWALERDPVSLARFAVALHRFFDRLAIQEEGLHWTDAALSHEGVPLEPRLEASLRIARCTLKINQGRFEDLPFECERLIEVARASGDDVILFEAYMVSLLSTEPGDERRALAHETVVLSRAIGDELLISLANVMFASTVLTDTDSMRELLSAGVATQLRLKRNRLAALSLMHWTIAEIAYGDPESARRVAQQAVDSCRSIEPTMVVRALSILVATCIRSGDLAGAHRYAREQLELAVSVHKPMDLRNAIHVIACLEERVEHSELVAKLLGFVDLHNLFTGRYSIPELNGVFAEIIAPVAGRLRDRLGQSVLDACTLEGSTWDEERAYAEVLTLLQ